MIAPIARRPVLTQTDWACFALAAMVAGLVWFTQCLLPDQEQRKRYEQHDNAGTLANPSISAVSQLATEQQKQRSDNQPYTLCSFLTTSPPADWALVIIAVVTAYLAMGTLRAIHEQIQIGAAAANAAETNAEAAKITAEAMRLSERAYVALSHVPPGIFIKSETGETLVIGTQAKITNHGNTPAKIHDSAVTYHVTDQPLPTYPDYERNNPKRKGFLVKNDTIYFHGTFELPRVYWNAVKDRLKTFYVIGYCEYSDVFGKRHRSGYGRVYDPSGDRKENYMWRGPSGLVDPPILNEVTFNNRSNLKFVTEEHYNYDIEIDEQGQPQK